MTRARDRALPRRNGALRRGTAHRRVEKTRNVVYRAAPCRSAGAAVRVRGGAAPAPMS